MSVAKALEGAIMLGRLRGRGPVAATSAADGAWCGGILAAGARTWQVAQGLLPWELTPLRPLSAKERAAPAPPSTTCCRTRPNSPTGSLTSGRGRPVAPRRGAGGVLSIRQAKRADRHGDGQQDVGADTERCRFFWEGWDV